MDKRKNNGGVRSGSGRKKGSGLSGAIKKHVDSFMLRMIEDEEIKPLLIKSLIQLSITEGWIYIIKDNKTGHIKIGATQKENPKQRLSHYSSHNMDISLLYIDKVNDCYEIETRVHESYLDNNIKGEWYCLTENDILGVLRLVSEFKYKKIFNGRW